MNNILYVFSTKINTFFVLIKVFPGKAMLIKNVPLGFVPINTAYS